MMGKVLVRRSSTFVHGGGVGKFLCSGMLLEVVGAPLQDLPPGLRSPKRLLGARPVLSLPCRSSPLIVLESESSGPVEDLETLAAMRG